MRLIEFIDRHEHGTIAMIKPCKDHANMLYEWCRDNNIPCIDKDKLHCTILFSKNPVVHLAKHNNKQLIIESKILGWKKLGEALTLELEAPKAHKLHQYMMNHGGSHDYPEYIAHTSVCYNWPQQEVPTVAPDFPLTFDRLHVHGIDPNFGN